jgi:subtilase family serine protease
MLLRALCLALWLAGSATASTHLVEVRGRGERALSALLVRQQDPASEDFRRWLTPREFGARFGAPARDLKRVSRWLRGAGCRVRRFPSRRLVGCTGPAALDVPPDLRALGTSDLPLRFHLDDTGLRPESIVADTFYFSPQEFARVYGLGSAIGAFVDGAGQSIGIVGISRVDPADVNRFRLRFGFPPADLEQVAGVRAPGQVSELEAILDVTWAGALAPGAHVVLAVGNTVSDSLAYLVNRADVSVITSSVSLCRSRRAHPYVAASRRLFRQAAAQGQTVLFASGDSGPRSCERGGLDPLVSSEWVTAVGGTQPLPTLDASGLAIAYGREVAWGGDGGASGGGVTGGRRPSYQRGRAHRTLPDVSLPATQVYPIGLDGRVGCCLGGTSAASPAWAAAIAQLNQVMGARAGFLNPRLYELGRAQRAGGLAVYHDVRDGSNSFDGVRGFRAHRGYDLATGWGTIDGPPFFAAFP